MYPNDLIVTISSVNAKHSFHKKDELIGEVSHFWLNLPNEKMELKSNQSICISLPGEYKLSKQNLIRILQ